VNADERISDQTTDAIEVAVQEGVSFVPSSDVAAAAEAAGLDQATTDAVVENYEGSQITSLKTGLLAAGFVAMAALFFTGGLPASRPTDDEDDDGLASVPAAGASP
jgi:hypothetical protein